MQRLIHRLLSETAAAILLIPHEFGLEHEVEACREVFRKWTAEAPTRMFLLGGQPDERELKWVIGQTSFFVGARMHACIAALSQGVPAVGLAYSKKFVGIFESVGAKEGAIDLTNTNEEDVVSKVVQAYSTREVPQQILRETMPNVRYTVTRTIHALIRHEQASGAA